MEGGGGMQTDIEELCGWPPDMALKLAYTFLRWQDVIGERVGSRARVHGMLVCKRWRDVLRDDDVWKIHCDREVAHREQIAKNWQEELEPQYFILTNQIAKRGETNKSLYEIFVLSQRLGSRLDVHRCGGPESLRIEGGSENRTLRQICLSDIRYIVNPTLQTLRDIFEDERDSRPEQISAMKSRLLTHAHAGNEVLNRESPRSMEPGHLALRVGQYLVASASIEGAQLNEKSIFKASSVMGEVSIADIAHGVEKLSGEELNIELSIRLARKSGDGKLEKVVTFQPSIKKTPFNLSDLDWPVYPVDALHYLFKRQWDSDIYDIYDIYLRRGEQESDEDYRKRSCAAREDCKKNWWESLAAPLKNLISEAYGEHLPDDLPYETLDFITQGNATLLHKMNEILWRDCQLVDAIMKVYRQHSSWISGMIRKHYSAVYGDAPPCETAKILLDIILEVTADQPYPNGLPSLSSLPKMTTSYCDSLPKRINQTLDRWNDLARAAQKDDDVAWSQSTLAELDEFADKFECSGYGRSELMGCLHHEFNPERMVTRFMYDTLSSNTRAFDRFKMKEDIKNAISSLEEFNANNQPAAKALEVMGKCDTAVDEFRRLSHYMHIREHAMLALIPLLPSLSRKDSAKLIWACFVDMTFSHGGRGVTFDNFECDNIPCCKEEEDPMRRFQSDWTMAVQWGMNHRVGAFSSKGVYTRLFGLPLPRNIILAMSDFLVQNLYREDLRDVNKRRTDSIFRVLPYLERSCAVTPEFEHVVLEGLGQAIGNAVSVAQQYDFEEIEPREMSVYQQVLKKLIMSCIALRAKQAIPSLRAAFQGTSGVILAQLNLVPLNAIEQRINEPQYMLLDSANLFG
ncbi:hypothetical protein THAOC_00806 [Thalassiosira oceanica]|uniref:F-box domain-containing protein n=1 Tax=Thalassiosira oceanica TaxID=159749 RepID=K0TR87_THAOC|nr:hypothetical protein THAOC_00806 [Thalassiosira oceanica]|eukprot:EJK77367.1 hypothetical protein THAOC_00806 [Thalassiosira oceanica]